MTSASSELLPQIALEGMTPVEMIGDVRFPPIRREPFMNRSSYSCPRCQPRPRL